MDSDAPAQVFPLRYEAVMVAVPVPANVAVLLLKVTMELLLELHVVDAVTS